MLTPRSGNAPVLTTRTLVMVLSFASIASVISPLTYPEMSGLALLAAVFASFLGLRQAVRGK
ncbi:hypothetical protein [Streptomyces gardneri]|uniref:hypothetical protein n=1 Tax=Streptomyces gardneri TaxID=66892 RepID=UPI0035DB8767